jgi:23S rRNA (pseudouridine1915-N3)-methyltransferase
MKIDLICVGTLKEKSLKELSKEYEKRISGYANLTIKEVKDESNNLPHDVVLKKEGERVLKLINPNSYVIIFDLNKKQMTSIDLAKKIEDIGIYHGSHITFIIGGSLGLDQEVKSKADQFITVSEMTFPHHLFRIMMLEQIYRSFKITEGSKYNK